MSSLVWFRKSIWFITIILVVLAVAGIFEPLIAVVVVCGLAFLGVMAAVEVLFDEKPKKKVDLKGWSLDNLLVEMGNVGHKGAIVPEVEIIICDIVVDWFKKKNK